MLSLSRCVFENLGRKETRMENNKNNKGQELKQPLYALLISPDDEKRQAILHGRIKATIREGWRDYRPGPVMLCCHIEPWAVMADIVKVRHCALWEITEEEILAGGFRSRAELIKKLKEFYPKIKANSPVTVIKWDNVKGYWVDNRELYLASEKKRQARP